jgi:hypothetical protein
MVAASGMAAPSRRMAAWLVALGPVAWTSYELARDPWVGSPAAAIRQRWLDPSAGDDWGMPTARWLVANAPPNALVAYGQMGKAPYLAALERPDVRFLDTVGWVDRRVADLYRPWSKVRELASAWRTHQGVSAALAAGREDRRRAFVDLVLSREPDLLLAERHLAHGGLDALVADSRFRERYERIEEAESIVIYRRKPGLGPETRVPPEP